MGKVYANRGRPSSEKGQDFSAGEQGELFERLAGPAVIGRSNAPCLDVWPELLGAIHHALREARENGITRERVVDRMNLALRCQPPITKRQLDCWTANSRKDRHFPLEYLPAFCWAVSSDLPLRILASTLGFDLIDAREVAVKRLGDTHIQMARLRREQGVLTKTLGG
jgi:hypothetical protein